jgi:hypothetical protein
VLWTPCSCATEHMAWGARKGVDDLVERLARDDPTLTSLHVFRARTFGLQVRLRSSHRDGRSTTAPPDLIHTVGRRAA